jgi:hypothetical protein
MNFTKKKKVLTATLTGLLLILISVSGFSQTNKKKTTHDQERLDADAAAVAFINCKYELAKYYSDNKPDDIKLKKDLNDASLLKLQFNNQVAGKYRTPAELLEDFNKEVNSVKKDLKTCVKYQNILVANEKLKKIN